MQGFRISTNRFCALGLQRSLVPRIEFSHAFIDLHLVMPTQTVEFAHINELSWRSVGFVLVPTELAFEAYYCYNLLRQLSDSQLLSCTHIDMAVAYLTQRRDSSTASFGVVSVYLTIGFYTVEHRRILLYAYDVLEINIQKNINTGVGHVFAP